MASVFACMIWNTATAVSEAGMLPVAAPQLVVVVVVVRGEDDMMICRDDARRRTAGGLPTGTPQQDFSMRPAQRQGACLHVGLHYIF